MYGSRVRTSTSSAAGLLGAVALAVALASSALAQTTVRCESKDGTRVSCPADTSQGVVLSKQISTDGCWQNETWGTDAKGIWVSNHCAAEFMVSGGATKPASSAQTTAASTTKEEEKKGGGKKKALLAGAATAAVVTAIAVSGDDDDDDWGYRYDGDGDIVRCESTKDQRKTCPIHNNSRVELVRQLSDANCRRGDSWGTNSNSIWVDDGCRGDFRVRSNDKNERVERNTRNDQAREKTRNIDKDKAKEKVKKEGGL